MANKFYNKQTTTKLTGKASPDGDAHGASLKSSMGKHADVMPGLPGKTGHYPGASGEFEVASIYPVSEGIDG